MIPRICHLPRMYLFAIIGFFGTLVGYMMKISLDVTLPHMVNSTVPKPTVFDQFSCPNLGISAVLVNQTEVEPMQVPKSGQFDWDEQTQAKISSALTTAYIWTQFFGGVIADQYGGKRSMLAAFLILSIATFIIPCFTKWLGSEALYYLRLFCGVGLGQSIPVLMSMMTKWVPADERAFIASIIFPGALLGHVIGSYFGGMIVSTAGWEAVYYAFGMLGLMWCCLWAYYVFSDPNEHPDISELEMVYLNDNVTSLIRSTKYDLDPLPWKAYILNGPLWGVTFAYIGREWAFAIFTTEVPKYLRDVLRFDITTLDSLKYMPYVCMWIASLLCGFTCDVLIKKGCCSVKNARKMFTSIGALGSTLCMFMIMFVGCSKIFAVFCMFMGMVFLAPYYSGCLIGVLDLTPNYAGSTIGMVDNTANSFAFLVPMMTTKFVKDALLSQWRISFGISIIIMVFSLPLYLFYVQGEQVWWDDVRKNGYPNDWKHGLLACEGMINENGQSIYIPKKNERDTYRLIADNDLSEE